MNSNAKADALEFNFVHGIRNHDCPKENERAITGHNQEQPQKKTPTSLSDNC